MNALSQIPFHQLLADREASFTDISVCHTAIAAGISHHRDGMPVQYRLERNREIIGMIDAELKRRGHYIDAIPGAQV